MKAHAAPGALGMWCVNGGPPSVFERTVCSGTCRSEAGVRSPLLWNEKTRNKVNPGSYWPFFPLYAFALPPCTTFSPGPQDRLRFFSHLPAPICLHRQAAACPNQLLPGATQHSPLPARSFPSGNGLWIPRKLPKPPYSSELHWVRVLDEEMLC